MTTHVARPARQAVQNGALVDVAAARIDPGDRLARVLVEQEEGATQIEDGVAIAFEAEPRVARAQPGKHARPHQALARGQGAATRLQNLLRLGRWCRRFGRSWWRWRLCGRRRRPSRGRRRLGQLDFVDLDSCLRDFQRRHRLACGWRMQQPHDCTRGSESKREMAAEFHRAPPPASDITRSSRQRTCRAWPRSSGPRSVTAAGAGVSSPASASGPKGWRRSGSSDSA